MEEMIETVVQLADILDGKTKADNANNNAQTWLKVTCFMFAYEVAKTPTKQGRADQLALIKQNNPLFYEDTKSIAKELYKNERIRKTSK